MYLTKHAIEKNINIALKARNNKELTANSIDLTLHNFNFILLGNEYNRRTDRCRFSDFCMDRVI